VEKPFNAVYIHFLDFYHLKRAMIDNLARRRQIYKEADLASRIALLFAKSAIIPLSSYFESDLCKYILRRLPDFVSYGVIKVSAGDLSIADHIESKRISYDHRSPEALMKAYRNRNKIPFPSYVPKKHSSTTAIRSGWLDVLNQGDPRTVLDPQSLADLDLPLNFHPAAIRVSAGFMPSGAGGATCDRRSWSGFAEVVRPLAAANEGELKGVAPQIAAGQAAGGATTQPIQTPGAVPAPPIAYATYLTAAEPDASTIALLQARNQRVIETAGFLQTAIFGVVIVGAGYFLFADKWVGTPADFAATLFWAFGTDIGADAATTAAKAFKK